MRSSQSKGARERERRAVQSQVQLFKGIGVRILSRGWREEYIRAGEGWGRFLVGVSIHDVC